MSRPPLPLLALALALASAPAFRAPCARADERAASEVVAPTLRLVPLEEGLLRAVLRGDWANLPEAKVQRLAGRVGLDLRTTGYEYVARRYDGERLFYVFYKQAEDAFGDRPYLIQRIRRTERNWRPGASEPEVEVTYQVEVFKTRDGATKRPDQHHGSYGLGDYARREIVKEYEIGFGEVPGLCEGEAWPFDPGILFRYLYRYGEEADVYDRVAFRASTPWTLTVALDAGGGWRVASPELGFDLPEDAPEAAGDGPASTPDAEDGGAGPVLVAGRGPPGVEVGTSTWDDVRARYGEPLHAAHPSGGKTNHHYPDGLVFNVGADGHLNTVWTRPGFAGRTAAGIRHGDTRGRVIDVMGPPAGQDADARTWRYEGILFWFDASHRVEKIVVFRS